MHNTPCISIIMTTYNEQLKYLKECLESIRNQTYTDFELIMVVEPNEANYEYIFNLSKEDNRINIVQNNKKLGFVSSLNVAIKQSKGKYLARIDSDDYCHTHRLEKQVSFLESNPNISIVGSNLHLVDEFGNIVGTRKYPEFNVDIVKSFLFSCALPHPTVMMRKSDLVHIGLYNEIFTNAEDIELWLRSIFKGYKLHNLQDYLVYYRTPSDEFTKRKIQHWEFYYLARRM